MSENENIYVRQDVYNANMARIESLMAASEARHEKMTAQNKADYERIANEIRKDAEVFKQEMRGEIKNLHTKIDGVADAFGFALNETRDSINRLGFIMSAVGIALVIVQLGIAYFTK